MATSNVHLSKKKSVVVESPVLRRKDKKIVMRSFKILFWITFLSLAVGSMPLWAADHEVRIQVDGLSCPFCVAGLKNSLGQVKALEIIDIDYKQGVVHAKWDQNVPFDEAAIKQAVRDAGFTPRTIQYPAKIKT